MNDAPACRACGFHPCAPVLDLGCQPLANNLLRPEDLGQPEPRFPLRLFVCPACWLLQIGDLVPPAKLFCDYLYFSSFSDAMLAHARRAAEQHRREFRLGPQSLVVEIASNDGYLLRNFKDWGIPCLGIEPAANIARVSRELGIETLVEFFGRKLAERLRESGRSADLILGNNVFAHAPDTNDFVAGLSLALKPDGAVVLEFPYGGDFIEKTEFDTAYHEHVFYFTLTPLLPLFQKHGLEIFQVEMLPIHGGSLRVYAGHRGKHPVRPSVAALLTDEERRGITRLEYYETFTRRVGDVKDALLRLLDDLKQQGCHLAAYGASAKGSTLLNYCGIGAERLEFVADRSPHKQGRLTPGTHLPIVGPEELARRRPDYTLLLTWNFNEEILAQQQAYRQAGGKFIIPIPEVRVV